MHALAPAQPVISANDSRPAAIALARANGPGAESGKGKNMPRLAMAAQAGPAPVAEPGLAVVRVEVEAVFRLGPK